MAKYVWINLTTGEFSNSWDLSFMSSRFETEEEMIKDLTGKNHPPEWKLIKYECLTDSEFEFYNLMKLK